MANPSHASARHCSNEKPIYTTVLACSLPRQIAQSTMPKLLLLKVAGWGSSTAQASLLFELLSQNNPMLGIRLGLRAIQVRNRGFPGGISS